MSMKRSRKTETGGASGIAFMEETVTREMLSFRDREALLFKDLDGGINGGFDAMF